MMFLAQLFCLVLFGLLIRSCWATYKDVKTRYHTDRVVVWRTFEFRGQEAPWGYALASFALLGLMGLGCVGAVLMVVRLLG
jgi:hypothetical protein